MGKRNKDLVAVLDGESVGHKSQAKMVRTLAALRVECPSEGAVIAQPSYTFHLAATPGTGGVEISIDRGEWMPCREALGLWWYDWSGYEVGEHEVSARTTMGDGVSIVSAPRPFSVE